MPIWAILTFVLAGIAVGLAEPGRFAYAFRTAALTVFLPPLLFEAAWNLDVRHLMRAWKPVFALAVPGVVITTIVVAGGLVLAGFQWLPALLVGAIVSATDPIAVTAIFRRVAVPEMLSTIVQSESLLNDATAVLVYRAILTAIAVGLGASSGLLIATQAVVQAAGGIIVGAGLGIAIASLVVRRRGATIQIGATLCGAYAAYLACEPLHLSGIFAVITFGIALREAERRQLSIAVAKDVERFWDVFALLVNALVFFLTGAAFDLASVERAPVAAAGALAGIFIARLVLAYLLTPLAMGRFIDRRWLGVIRVANVRGALSLAMAIALPLSIVARSAIIEVTFTVVLATLLLSALTVPRAVSGFKT